MENQENGIASRQELEALLFDPDLETLETLIAEFNIFEALGAVRQELRHSDFLAFLLDPNENHGLGDSFLKRFLRRVLRDAPDPPLSAIEIDLLDLDDALVLREWYNIDILIDDDRRNNLVVVIENKIGSSEHDNQLARYLKIARQHYPKANIVSLYLTPEGIEPSEDNYIPVSYDTVAVALERLLKAQSSTMGPDVRTLVAHYVSMLRRHIVSDSEMVELCQNIYRKHKNALDMLFEYRPDVQAEIAEYCTGLVSQTSGITFRKKTNSRVTFLPDEWMGIDVLNRNRDNPNEGWPLIINFVFKIEPASMNILLLLGRGNTEVRQILFAMARNNSKIFRGSFHSLTPYSTRIYALQILKKSDYQDATLEDLKPKIDKAWQRFIEKDLPPIREAILNADLPAIES